MKNEKSRPFKKGEKRPERSDKRSKERNPRPATAGADGTSEELADNFVFGFHATVEALQQGRGNKLFLQEDARGEKIEQLKELGYNDIVWHFIGPIQKNKTKLIATHFDIVESVDRVIVAKRLAEQRPDNLKPLEVLIQVNISDESQKSGCAIADIDELIKEIQSLKKLKLRGFMGIGKDTDNRDEITEEFAQLKNLFDKYMYLIHISRCRRRG